MLHVLNCNKKTDLLTLLAKFQTLKVPKILSMHIFPNTKYINTKKIFLNLWIERCLATNEVIMSSVIVWGLPPHVTFTLCFQLAEASYGPDGTD